LQIEIQDYHRDQLEKDGIFLPPREETVLTLSGNFTQKELDKAAKKGTTKKQSSRSEPIAAPTVEKSFDEMLQVLAIPKTEIKALSGAQNQTQFDYVKQRIFEQTGEIWEWEGAPKDGKWVKVNDAIAATAKPKSTKKPSTKSDADRRFTLQEAVDFYNSAHPSDRPLKTNSLKQNAKMYGFMIKERGSGMYALINS
jgi:hypothetical protein